MKTAQLRKSLTSFVTKAMDKFTVPGVSVGILHEGEELSAGFGVTNVDYPQAVDQETLFQIGSTTKTFTATVIMRLVDEGKINLEKPVVTYLPTFDLADKKVAKRVTVRHLLTHTGGWLGDYFDDFGRGDDALRKVVAALPKKAPQLTPLGEVWSYNNSGFYVAGRLIETITKKPYETVVREIILDPLEMKKSFFYAEEAITYKVASGHRRTKDGLVVVRPWHLPRTAHAAGGIISTAPDQLKYARLHLGDGLAADGSKVISKESLNFMQQPLGPAGSMADFIGVSWLLEDYGKTRIVKHGGTTGGQLSAFAMVPEHGFAITVLTNGDRGHELDALVTDWAYKTVLGVTRPDPRPKKVAKKVLATLAGEYGTTDQSRLVVTLGNDGNLVIETKVAAKTAEEHPEAVMFLPPAVRLMVTGDDRGVIIDDPMNGRRVEFVKGATGDIEWIRWGGRIVRRAAEPIFSGS